MTEVNQDFTVYQGDAKQVTTTVKDENGAILPLNGYTAEWTMYKKSSKAVVLSKSIGDGLAIPTPANGEVILTLDEADTDDVPTGTYDHELDIISALGKRSTVTTGEVEIKFSKS